MAGTLGTELGQKDDRPASCMYMYIVGNQPRELFCLQQLCFKVVHLAILFTVYMYMYIQETILGYMCMCICRCNELKKGQSLKEKRCLGRMEETN